jgi:hypothetical protein
VNKARDSSRQIEMKTGCAWHPVLTILVKKNGRGDWTRTSDLVVPDHARYQLRHTPTKFGLLRRISLADAKQLWDEVALGVPNDARYHLRHNPVGSIVAAQSLRGKR